MPSQFVKLLLILAKQMKVSAREEEVAVDEEEEEEVMEVERKVFATDVTGYKTFNFCCSLLEVLMSHVRMISRLKKTNTNLM